MRKTAMGSLLLAARRAGHAGQGVRVAMAERPA